MYAVIGLVEGKWKAFNKEALNIDEARELEASGSVGQTPHLVPWISLEEAIELHNAQG